MFIHLALPEDDSMLINTDSIKAISSIKIRDSRMYHGIRIEFLNRKESDFILQFSNELSRDAALKRISEAIAAPISLGVLEVELRPKGYSPA